MTPPAAYQSSVKRDPCRKLPVVAIAVVLGCANDAPPGGSAPGGSATTTPQPLPAGVPTLAAYCEATVQSVCGMMAQCGALTDAAGCQNGPFGGQVASLCMDFMRPHFDGLAIGHLVLDPGVLQQCRTHLAATCWLNLSGLLCSHAFRSVRTSGQSCYPSFDCADGVCEAVPTMAGNCSDGTCVARKVGDPCKSQVDCGPKLVCGNGACRTPGELGQPCGEATPCRPDLDCKSGSCSAAPTLPACPKQPGEGCLYLGLKCEATPAPQRGEPPPAPKPCKHRFQLYTGVGSKCGSTAVQSVGEAETRHACREDLLCDPASGTCVAPSAPGSPCSPATACGIAAVCVNGKCATLPSLGQACSGACASTAKCSKASQTCVAPKPLGASCGANSECDSGDCKSGVCKYDGCGK